MKASDFLLLVINAAKQDGLSPVQLQKSLFLIRHKLSKSNRLDFYNFIPQYFGPFNSQIYIDAEKLKENGLIDIHNSPLQNYKMFNITSEGSKQAKIIKKSISSIYLDEINKTVERVKSKSFNDLLKYIYTKYPEYKKNSIFSDFTQ